MFALHVGIAHMHLNINKTKTYWSVSISKLVHVVSWEQLWFYSPTAAVMNDLWYLRTSLLQ